MKRTNMFFIFLPCVELLKTNFCLLMFAYPVNPHCDLFDLMLAWSVYVSLCAKLFYFVYHWTLQANLALWFLLQIVLILSQLLSHTVQISCTCGSNSMSHALCNFSRYLGYLEVILSVLCHFQGKTWLQHRKINVP